jgi:hypothetical protein
VHADLSHGSDSLGHEGTFETHRPLLFSIAYRMLGMYPDRRLNAVVVAGSLLALAVFWVLLREQVAVSDRQFLRSMIPHHAGAILMCEQSPI